MLGWDGVRDNGDNGDWRLKKKKRKPSSSFSLFGEKQYIILIILSERDCTMSHMNNIFILCHI